MLFFSDSYKLNKKTEPNDSGFLVAGQDYPSFKQSLIQFHPIKKPVNRLAFLSSGDRTRTYDLWVMSPASYQLLHPAMLWDCKGKKKSIRCKMFFKFFEEC